MRGERGPEHQQGLLLITGGFFYRDIGETLFMERREAPAGAEELRVAPVMVLVGLASKTL